MSGRPPDRLAAGIVLQRIHPNGRCIAGAGNGDTGLGWAESIAGNRKTGFLKHFTPAACLGRDGTGVSTLLHRPACTARQAFRNRVAHREAIIQWDLPRHCASKQDIIRWLSPDARERCNCRSRFPEKCPDGGLHDAKGSPTPTPCTQWSEAAEWKVVETSVSRFISRVEVHPRPADCLFVLQTAGVE